MNTNRKAALAGALLNNGKLAKCCTLLRCSLFDFLLDNWNIQCAYKLSRNRLRIGRRTLCRLPVTLGALPTKAQLLLRPCGITDSALGKGCLVATKHIRTFDCTLGLLAFATAGRAQRVFSSKQPSPDAIRSLFLTPSSRDALAASGTGAKPRAKHDKLVGPLSDLAQAIPQRREAGAPSTTPGTQFPPAGRFSWRRTVHHRRGHAHP